MKKAILVLLMLFLLLTILIFIVVALAYLPVPVNEQERVDGIVENVRTQIEQFPDYENTENYVVCYYRGEDYEYVYVQRDGKRLIGKRSEESGTTFWYYDSSVKPDPEAAEVVQTIREMADQHLIQENVTYTYVEPELGRHHFTSSYDRYYVLAERQDKYTVSCAEVMASQTTSQGAYTTWGRYEGESKDVIFLIQISEFPTRFGDTSVPGWGVLPKRFYQEGWISGTSEQINVDDGTVKRWDLFEGYVYISETEGIPTCNVSVSNDKLVFNGTTYQTLDLWDDKWETPVASGWKICLEKLTAIAILPTGEVLLANSDESPLFVVLYCRNPEYCEVYFRDKLENIQLFSLTDFTPVFSDNTPDTLKEPEAIWKIHIEDNDYANVKNAIPVNAEPCYLCLISNSCNALQYKISFLVSRDGHIYVENVETGNLVRVSIDTIQN